MVFQRPNPLPVSVYENVVFGKRLHAAEQGSEEVRSRRRRRIGADRSRSLGRSQGSPRHEGDGAPARAAAKALHRASLALEARHHLDGRAVLRARRRGHARHRGAHVGAPRPLHARHRDAQHGPGAARERRVRVHAARRSHRAPPHGGSLLESDATRAPPSTSKGVTGKRRHTAPRGVRAAETRGSSALFGVRGRYGSTDGCRGSSWGSASRRCPTSFRRTFVRLGVRRLRAAGRWLEPRASSARLPALLCDAEP